MGTSGTPRAIGVWGTIARAAVGAFLLGGVLYGHAARGWHPVAWLVGLMVFPALITAALWWRARRHPTPLRVTGPLGHAVNLAVFGAPVPGRRPWESVVDVELLLSPRCPNAATARSVLTACLRRLGLDMQVREWVGDYPSPTILVDGVDVMTAQRGAPPGQACRLDVPTAARVVAVLRRRSASSTSEDAA